ncbi:hypothetical protein Bca4012_062135 [Brassica carinata]
MCTLQHYVPTVFDNFSANVVKKTTAAKLAMRISPRRHYAPGVPIILVGTELDLQDDKQFFIDHPGAVPISTHQGEELKKLIGSAVYIECSSKTQQNVKAVFDAAMWCFSHQSRGRRKRTRTIAPCCDKRKSLKTRK